MEILHLHDNSQEKIPWNFIDRSLECYEMGRTAQKKMKFSINDFFSICDQICSLMRIWSHLLKKYFMENFIFSVVTSPTQPPFAW